MHAVEGEDRVAGEVGHEEHVRLLDPAEALDRGAVEHDLALQGLAELALRHLHVLVLAHDVGEDEAKKPDPSRCIRSNIAAR